MQTITNLAASGVDFWIRSVGHSAWQGLIVGLLALAVVTLGKRWPSPVRYWILLLALIKFAAPPLIPLPTGLFSLVAIRDAHAATTTVAAPLDPAAPAEPFHAISTAVAESNPTGVGPLTPGESNTRSAALVATPVENRPGERHRPRPAIDSVQATAWIPGILMTVHLAGAALILVLFALRGLQLRAAWRRMQQPEPLLVELCDSIAREMGLPRRPEVRISHADAIPYSMGIIHPVVVIPARNIEQLSHGELDTVLYHELAHHRRGDLRMNLLQLVIGAIWWFHPVVWLLNRAIRTVREECCDDLLLTHKFVSDADYCTTLVHVADVRGLPRPGTVVVAISMVGGSHPLTHRIRRIMDERLARAEKPGTLAIIALLIMAAVFLPGLSAAPRRSNEVAALGAAAKDAARARHASPQYDNHEIPEFRDGTGRSGSGQSTTEMTLGGRIVDEENRPVAGAAVTVGTRLEGRRVEGARPVPNDFEATTAADGTWSITRLPVLARVVKLQISHPDFAGLPPFRPDDSVLRQLRESQDERVLKKGIPVSGSVVYQGQPVTGATVALGQYFDNFDFPSITTTGEDGTFRFAHAPPGNSLLTAFKVGLAPYLQTVSVSPSNSAFEAALQPPQRVKLRIVDKAGVPVANAAVSPFQWADTVTLSRLHQFGKTDDNGLWTWDWAPDRELPYLVTKPGYIQIRDANLRPGPNVHELQLQPEMRADIGVCDDATGFPVQAFRATAGIVSAAESQPVQWLKSQDVVSTSGEYSVRQDAIPWKVCVVRIEADGYLPVTTREIAAAEESVAIVARLKRIEQKNHEGIALNADGSPAAAAAVLVGTRSRPLSIGDLQSGPAQRKAATTTDRSGRFQIVAQDGDFTAFVIATSGIGRVARDDFHRAGDEPLQISLTPWAGVTGVLRSRQSAPGNEIVTLSLTPATKDQGLDQHSSLQTRTDTSGHFRFERVPPGYEVMLAHLKEMITERGPFLGNFNATLFQLQAGQQQTMTLGGTGRTLIGRFRLKDPLWAVDWQKSSGLLHPMDEAAVNGVIRRPPPRFSIEEDGSFRMEDVPSGPYRVVMAFLALKPESTLARSLRPEQKGMSGLVVVDRITVPDAAGDQADQAVDLGNLPVGPPTLVEKPSLDVPLPKN